MGWSVWFGLLITPVMISAGQILFKITSARLESPEGSFWRVLIDPYLGVALAIYGTGTLVWIYVLRNLPLAYAYPFMAMSFCLVPLFSIMVFGEAVTIRYWIGTGLIIVGMVVINY